MLSIHLNDEAERYLVDMAELNEQYAELPGNFSDLSLASISE